MASGRREALQTGKCKWFNVVKGFGFVTPDDGSQDVFVHQSVIQMKGFRSLGDGEKVEFESRESDKGVEATYVSGIEGDDCRGSERRPVSRKKYKKIRCYNCGDFANHVAAKCPHGPLPKRCHFCKADDHLIADCPTRNTEAHSDDDNDNDDEDGNDGDTAGDSEEPARQQDANGSATPAAAAATTQS